VLTTPAARWRRRHAFATTGPRPGPTLRGLGSSAPRSIADLVTGHLSVDVETAIGDVVNIFQRESEADSVAVIDGARVGIIARSRFFLQLGRRFGYSLYEHRPARLLMEEGSTVDAAADPVEVIALATQREPLRLYDDILVLSEGRYAGTVSMRSLLVHHKDLLLASVAEIGSLERENRRLSEERDRLWAAQARTLEAVRLPLHALRGALRVVASDPILPPRHLGILRDVLARTQEMLASLGTGER
jgi:hypothetical protein